MRKSLVTLIVFMLIMGPVFYASAQDDGNYSQFSDVTVNHWAFKQIANLKKMNYISGYTDGSFKPNNNITRAEFMTLLGNVLKDQYPSGAIYDYSKEKQLVSNNHWAHSSINDVFKYMPSEYRNKFNVKAYQPDALISRGEVVEVIGFALSKHNNFYGGGAGSSEIVPEDSRNSEYAGPIELCLLNGVIGGYPDGTFRPNNKITRAEISSIIINVIDLISKPRPW